jgi:acyl-CoA dehydrogenase
MTTTHAQPTSAQLVDAARRIGQHVAGVWAPQVDADARFPNEAIDALRAEGLLGAAIPVELGGMGVTLDTIGHITTALARHCASTAMIYAMHQIQIFTLVRHSRNEVLLGFIRQVAADQLLLASATTEIGRGGDVRSSTCALEPAEHGGFSFRKQAPVISYGRSADAVLATARRTPDSPPSDQVLVLCSNHAGGSLELTETSGWDSLGFRGTCSSGFVLSASVAAAQVLDDPYAVISSSTMLPVSHLLWAAVWLGIAQETTDTARRFVQAEARKKLGSTPPGALRLAELMVLTQQLEQSVAGLTARYLAIADDEEQTGGLEFTVSINVLKISASTTLSDVATKALLICGIAGYQNGSKFSITRAIRDALGASVMISNDRILHNNAQLALGMRER